MFSFVLPTFEMHPLEHAFRSSLHGQSNINIVITDQSSCVAASFSQLFADYNMGRGYDDFPPRGHTTGSRSQQSSGMFRDGGTQGETHMISTQVLRHILNHKGLAGSQEQSMVSQRCRKPVQ
jgi:hypothetical protein